MTAKLEQLERAVADCRLELAELEEKAEGDASRKEEALELAVRQAPREKPYRVGGRPQKLERDYQELTEKEIPRKQRELAAREAAYSEEAVKARTERLRALERKAKAFTPQEKAGWEKLGEWLAEGHKLWLENVVAPAEARDRIYHEAQSEGLLNDQEARQAFDEAAAAVAVPFPITFERTLEVLYAVMFARANSSKAHEWGRTLAPILPDLAGEFRVAQLSGRVDKTSSGGGPFYAEGTGRAFGGSLATFGQRG